jgi:hypothetical protein
MGFKKRLGYDDVRFKNPDCKLCGPSTFNGPEGAYELEPQAFAQDAAPVSYRTNGRNGAAPDMDDLVRTITDQVMAALNGAGV